MEHLNGDQAEKLEINHGEVFNPETQQKLELKKSLSLASDAAAVFPPLGLRVPMNNVYLIFCVNLYSSNTKKKFHLPGGEGGCGFGPSAKIFLSFACRIDSKIIRLFNAFLLECRFWGASSGSGLIIFS